MIREGEKRVKHINSTKRQASAERSKSENRAAIPNRSKEAGGTSQTLAKNNEESRQRARPERILEETERGLAAEGKTGLFDKGS